MPNSKSIGVVFTHNDPLRTATTIVSKPEECKGDLNLQAAATLVKQSGSSIVVKLADNISRISTDYGDLYVVNPPVDHDAITAAYAMCTVINSKLVNTITAYSINQNAPGLYTLIRTEHIPMSTAKIETVINSSNIGAIQLELVNIIGNL